MGGGWEMDSERNLDIYDDGPEPTTPYDEAMWMVCHTDRGAADVARALAGAPSAGPDGDVWQLFDQRHGLGAFRGGTMPPDAQALLHPPVGTDLRRVSDGFGPDYGVHLFESEYGVMRDLHGLLEKRKPGQVCVVTSVLCDEGDGGRLMPRGVARMRKFKEGLADAAWDAVMLDRRARATAGATGTGQVKTPAEAAELARLFGCRVRILGPGMPMDDDSDFGWGRYYAVVGNDAEEVEGVVECWTDERGAPMVWAQGLVAILAVASSPDHD